LATVLWLAAAPGLHGQTALFPFLSAPPGRIGVGTEAQVTFGADNVGADTATGVVATITVPNALPVTVVTSTVGNAMVTTGAVNQTVTANIGNLAPFGFFNIGISFVPGLFGSHTLTGMVSAANAPAVGSSTTLNVFPADASLNPGNQLTGGDPVGTFAGNYVEFEPPDLVLGGPGVPVFFERYYDSALFADGVVKSALGHNWQHNYDISLSVNGTNAVIGFRRGRLLRFQNDGANWNQVGNTQIGFRLIETGGGFLLGDPRSQMMYFFDGDGLLTRIEDGRGNTNFLSYTGSLLTSVNDGLGRSLNFSYDSSGLLTNVTDGIRSVSYAHTGTNLTSFTDANGKVTTYAYDAANTNNPGLMTARTLPEGNTPMMQVYSDAGRVVIQTDAADNTNTLAYATQGGTNTTTMTDPLGHTLLHIYNSVGELIRLTDEAGQNLSVGVDAVGRRNQVVDRKGQTTGITYNSTNGLPTRIDHPQHNDDQFFYATRSVNGINFFDLNRILRPDGTQDRYGYDAAGNLIAYTNRTSHIWRFANNARGQLLSSTNPIGGVASFTYDASARLASASDSDVGVTTFAYDPLNRLTNVTHPNPDTIRFTYDPLNRLTSVTDERTNTTTFAFDDNSRLSGVTNALGQETHFQYDGLNRLTRAVDRLGNAATFGYDPRTMPASLLSAVTNRNGFVTRLEYDARRRLTAVVDPAGRTNAFGYDNEGLLTSASNPLGETLGLKRDAMGYVTNLTDPLGGQTGFDLDGMKRIIRIYDPLGRRALFGRDNRGLIITATRQPFTGNPIMRSDYTYDGLGNLTRLEDPNDRFWDFAYTPMGRLASFKDPLNRTNFYTYDTRGRLATVRYPDGATRTNTYDGANNLTRMQFSDGTDFQYAYDALNRLTNAAGSDPVAFTYDAMDRLINTRQVGLDFGAAYDADGRLTSVSYNNGQFTVTYTYDSRDRLIGVSDSLTGTSLTFAYDDANRLTGLTRPNGVNGTYNYDARGLLTRIQEGSVLDIQYTLDAAGQVTEADFVTAPIDPGSVATGRTNILTYDNASQISTAGYQYDPRGRLTNAPNTAFTWDGASRLRAIDGVTYTYNALSELETRTEGANTNRYFYNYAVGLAPIMAERNDSTGQFTRFYVWSPGGRLLYLIELPGNAIRFPLFDRVGSTLALTDSAGAVTGAYAYNAYGRVLAQTGTSTQPFRFNGAFGIRADGPLYQMRARWYDPVAARFLSKEPIWPVLQNPGKLNPYQYALRNPLIFYDATGTEEQLTPRQEQILAENLGDLSNLALFVFALAHPDPNYWDKVVEYMKTTGASARVVLGTIPVFNGTYLDDAGPSASAAGLQVGGPGSQSPPAAGRFKRWTGRSPWPKPRELNSSLDFKTIGTASPVTQGECARKALWGMIGGPTCGALSWQWTDPSAIPASSILASQALPPVFSDKDMLEAARSHDDWMRWQADTERRSNRMLPTPVFRLKHDTLTSREPNEGSNEIEYVLVAD
jgi:RHS repeat-associated protein